MVDAALQRTEPAARAGVDRGKALARHRISDAVFEQLTRVAAIAVLVILGGVIVSLVRGSLPAFSEFGFEFFTSSSWNPVKERFGAAAPIYGTIVTSVIAMLIAVPLGLGIAIFLTELCPKVIRRPIAIAIELLAGIPSNIYGIWGLFFFAPFLQQNVQPFLMNTLGKVPGIGLLFEGAP